MSSAPVPEQLGRYRILSKLGQGGMGTVYLAEDTFLSRRVAIKVPHFSESDGTTVIERFHREARAAAGIDHPNICPVHDAGQVEGIHFLVMPYIEGTPLSRQIDEGGPWPAARAAAVVRQLALAIEVLHQRGLIHRDLKASNVLVRPNGEPVLMDFGLARSFNEQSRLLTQLGTVLGTPPYMAPEQILGNKEAIGPATDIYSLGVILYELLTRSLPFEGPPAAVYGQILHAEPEPPSARRPGLDANLDRVCLKALAKDPAGRFPSMTTFAEALMPWVCPVAVVADPAPVPPVPPPLFDPPFIPPPPPVPEPLLIVPPHADDPPLIVPPPAAEPLLIEPTTVSDPPLLASPTVSDPPLIALPPPLAEPPPLMPPPPLAGEPRLTCPGCGKGLKVPPNLAGKRLKCPRCQTILSAAAAAPFRPLPRPPSVGTAAPVRPRTVAAPPPSPPGPVAGVLGRAFRIAGLTVLALLAVGLMSWVMVTLEPGLAVLTDLVVVTLIAWLLWHKGKPAAGPPASAAGETPPLVEEIEEVKRPTVHFYNGAGMKLVLLPAGKFLMGSPKGEKERCDNEILHEVEITRPFYLSATAVTQEQYQKVTGTNPSWFSSTGGGRDRVQGMDTRRFPVESVSWDEAVEFCRKLSEMPGERAAGRQYRLPTEAEWEYACRGGAALAPFHFFDSLSSAQANIDGNHPYGGAAKGPCLGRTSEVGSYPPNAFGLFDMHGNVGEWCSDWFGSYPAEDGPARDPGGPPAGTRRVLRGGSWFHYGKLCRSAHRGSEAPGNRGNCIGFRVVCVAGGGAP